MKSAPTVLEVLNAVESAIARGEFARAQGWLRRVRETAPLHYRVFHLGAMLHRAAKREGLAIDCLRRSLMVRPENALAWTQVGVLLKSRSELVAALAAQIRATTIEPVSPDLLYNLANILIEVSRPDRASVALSRALELAPLASDLHRSLATTCLRLAEPASAVSPARRAVLICPDVAVGYLTASTAEWEIGERDSARRLLERALGIAPLDPEILSNTVWQALEMGALDVAVVASKRAALAEPGALVPMLKFSGAILEARGIIPPAWRWSLCLAGRVPRGVEDLAVGRIMSWRNLTDPATRRASTTFVQPDEPVHSSFEKGGRFLLEVRDAIVLPRSQTILTGDGAVLHEGLSPFTILPGMAENDAIYHWNPKGTAVLKAPRPAVRMPRAMLLGTGGSGNYYHWLIDFLPRLHTVMAFRANIGEPGSIPLLASEDCPPAIRELIGYLGVADGSLMFVPRDEPIAVDQLYVPALPSFIRPALGESIRWINTRLVEPLAAWTASGAPRPERVYLDRRRATERRVVNEDEMIEMLAEKGFAVVSPDPGSIRQQITSLASARVIVSPHGAGLANMSFAPSGCEIVELSYPSGNPPQISTLARACGHRHWALPCDTVPVAGLRPGRWDMRVPLDALAALLSRLPD